MKPPNAVRLLVIAAVAVAASLSAVAAPGARLSGLLLDTDGRAARGFTLHLIDGAGQDVARSTTGPDGLYAFDDLPSGSYSLGIEDPAGRMAVVDAAPLQLKGRALARRDVRLAQASPGGLDSATQANPSIGMWWAGLSPTARVFSVVGVVVFLLITITAIDDDDDDSNEPDSSPL